MMKERTANFYDSSFIDHHSSLIIDDFKGRADGGGTRFEVGRAAVATVAGREADKSCGKKGDGQRFADLRAVHFFRNIR